MSSTDKSTKTEKNKASEVVNDNDEDDRTIFVGNLAEKVTDELLYELFLQGGPVDEISIPKDRESGKQKSFGFVRYKHAASVAYACEIFKGTRLFGRDLNIKSRNRDAPKVNSEPRGLSALVQGFYSSPHNMAHNMAQNMLPKMGMAQVPNPMSMIDPIFLQTLATSNPYGDMKFGEYNNASDPGRNSYKDRNSRRNRDERRHNDDRRQHYGGDRRTDKWKSGRR